MVKHIVVVDDNKEMREIISFALGYHGFEVTTASNGAQLQTLLSLHKPDLILLDVMMPGQDGYQIFYRLRTNPRTSRIPVIIMTAHAEDIYARISHDLGAIHLTKPFHPLRMVEQVKALLAEDEP